MPIAVAVAVPEGVALAVDTYMSANEAIGPLEGPDRFRPAGIPFAVDQPGDQKRMFPVRMANSTFVLAFANSAELNDTSLYMVLKSLESKYTGNNIYETVLDYLIEGIKTELKNRAADRRGDGRPVRFEIEFILAGWREDGSRPIAKAVTIGLDAQPTSNEDSRDSFTVRQNFPPHPFGCCFSGRSEFPEYLFNGGNGLLPPLNAGFWAMGLKEALDYARFFVEFTCDYQRFSAAKPDCERPVITGILASESLGGFTFS
ncbi:MAG: hypothetical protein A4E57_02195 [Syntrophorhabdaceae bacterium PtaU1.Bin034]|jgi:hypothetical protein|nr:MAG: hypothetical protein A4E57_02195 [Syntrophorhabdaceae bacterium PtaU1.Bin034]